MLVRKKEAYLAANFAYTVTFISYVEVLVIKSYSNEWKIKSMRKSKRQESGSLFVDSLQNTAAQSTEF